MFTEQEKRRLRCLGVVAQSFGFEENYLSACESWIKSPDPRWRALAYYTAGNSEQALTILSDALEVAQNDGMRGLLYGFRGLLYRSLNEPEKARQDLLAGIALLPEDQRARLLAEYEQIAERYPAEYTVGNP